MPILVELEIGARLAMAFAMGAILGYERTYQKKPAGSRTHSLVCLASALFMVISIYGFGDLGPSEPSRIAAQVVTGMGFIGAGAIWREGSWVRGITTATTLWVCSALGLAVGCGLYIPALITMGLAWMGLEFYTMERIFTGRDQWLDRQLLIEGLDLSHLQAELERIFARPIKVSAHNTLDPYVISFTFTHSAMDPFTLTLAIKDRNINLTLLYIPEGMRLRGYARRVVNALVEWAHRNSFQQITVMTSTEVSAMWEKLGWMSIDPSTFVYRFDEPLYGKSTKSTKSTKPA